MTRQHAFCGALAAVLFFSILPAGGQFCLGQDTQTVELDPFWDQFGVQILTLQAYGDAADPQVALGFYDTGASVITFSQGDASDLGIPVKVADGAVAEGIDGTLVGDVSQPGTITADGLHAATITNLLPLEMEIDLTAGAVVPGVQTMLGTSDGSPSLPTITGTPIHNANPTHPDGSVAKIHMSGYEINVGALLDDMLADFDLPPMFGDIVFDMADIRFLDPDDPGTPITPGASAGDAVRIPLMPFGGNNYANPGDEVTYSPNPIQTGVVLHDQGNTTDELSFLFDLGAQLTIISPDTAENDLGLDLGSPEFQIGVVGAAGNPRTIPGYLLDALDLPRDEDGDGVPDEGPVAGENLLLELTQVPVFVLDLGIEGIDGILGTNLFNIAEQMLYDPTDPNPFLSVNFLDNPDRGFDLSELAAIDALLAAYPAFGGALSGGSVPGFQVVPEPSTLWLLAVGGFVLLLRRFRRRTT